VTSRESEDGQQYKQAKEDPLLSVVAYDKVLRIRHGFHALSFHNTIIPANSYKKTGPEDPVNIQLTLTNS